MDGRGISARDGLDRTAPVQDQVSLPAQDQVDGAVRCAHVERLKVGVENQYLGVHRLIPNSENYSTYLGDVSLPGRNCWYLSAENPLIDDFTINP